MRRRGSNSTMDEGSDAQLYDAFLAADADRDKIEDFKEQARRHPLETAVSVSKGISIRMEWYRQRAAELYGVDITDPEGLKGPKPKELNKAVSLQMMANCYVALLEHQRKVIEYAADSSLSRRGRATKICGVGVEALQTTEAVLLKTLHDLRVLAGSIGTPEAERVAKDAESLRLAGHLATRISLGKNRRLAKELDAIREHNKPYNRARLEALLRELYVLAPGVWDEHHNTDWQLLTTRSVAAKKIERRLSAEGSPPAKDSELATFVEHEREALLKRGRDAGLPPREYELFGLVMGNPERFLRNGKLNHREAAQEMGLAEGTIKSLWSRIRKTLAA